MPAATTGPDRNPRRLLNLPVPPVVVGGSGGSGTRLVAQVLRWLGVDLGAPLNGAGDAMALVPLYDRHIGAVLGAGAVDLAALGSDLEACLRRHVSPFPPRRPWGWKNPRSIYLLPWLDRLLPGMVFVHVIRHGLDIATSANQNQLHRHGDAVLGPGWRGQPLPLASVRLWAVVNGRAADYGRRMGTRYVQVRYEDLCRDFQGAVRRLAVQLGLVPPPGPCPVPLAPAPPRWPALEPGLRQRLIEAAGPQLQRFGYLEPCDAGEFRQ
ncbi:MAG TPA: hypothetical protein ENK50_00545 [Sedimenticola sp.]|nr:hypothetical protein [Sedimenticola sp.]